MLLIWVAIWGVLLAPSMVDVANGLVTRSTGCRVLNVVDGDTVALYCAGHGFSKARLIGFDTPEKFSPKCSRELVRAFEATWRLRWYIWRAGHLDARIHGTDRYGRLLVRLRRDGTDIAALMIGAGVARSYQGGLRAGWC